MCRLDLPFVSFCSFLLFQMHGACFTPPYPLPDAYPQTPPSVCAWAPAPHPNLLMGARRGAALQHSPPVGAAHLLHVGSPGKTWHAALCAFWLCHLPPGEPPGTPWLWVRVAGTHSLVFLPCKVVQDDSTAPMLSAHPPNKSIFLVRVPRWEPHFRFVFFEVVLCLFSIISSSLFLYDKSCLTFIFAPHGYGSLKSFSELSAERGRSGHPAAGLALSLSAEPCSDWVPLIMKRNKGEAASIEHAIDAKIKAEANKTELEREQFKESSRCFFFPYLVVQMQNEASSH